MTRFTILRLYQDLYYSAKLLCGAISGFDDLQQRFAGEWEYIEYVSTSSKDVWGEVSHTFEYDCEGIDPQYACVLWNNGTHTPLPVVLADGQYAIQDFLAMKLAWIPAFAQAQKACAILENQCGGG
jgi:hypothetical protein